MPMKRRKNNRAAKRHARENRRSYFSMALGLAIFALLIAPALLNIPTISPVSLVQAQVVRGEKIDPLPATPNSLAVLSNTVAATAPTNPPPTNNDFNITIRIKKPPADFNSLPEIIEHDGKKYLNLTFVKLASFPFKVTPEVADATENAESALRLTSGQVPENIKALTEKRAAVTGFMLPVRVDGGLTGDFLLLRNQSACCYGVMPRVNEWVIVRMAGKGVKPIMDVPVTALGTFHVGEMRENGHLVGIYVLDCDQLLPPK